MYIHFEQYLQVLYLTLTEMSKAKNTTGHGKTKWILSRSEVIIK